MAPAHQAIDISGDEAFRNAIFNPEDRRLFVVDVYASWCGPCKQMVPAFKTLSLSVDSFAERCGLLSVDASTVSELSPYSGTSQPLFLFYKDGTIIADVKGTNAPKIQVLIEQHLPAADAED
eukprot:GHVQ01015565.1.p1 GENE.GHVQ01015565.1~~GHVQ01015565.1.p1  ORF type:complete len:122 (-),score=14.70 GHVQ01015565.1:296-661(-)